MKSRVVTLTEIFRRAEMERFIVELLKGGSMNAFELYGRLSGRFNAKPRELVELLWDLERRGVVVWVRETDEVRLT